MQEEAAEERVWEAIEAQIRPLRAEHARQRRELERSHISQQQPAAAQPLPPISPSPPVTGARWDKILAAALGKCDKVARLSLSAFGRAFGAAGYGVSKLLFHAEFAPMPSQAAGRLRQGTCALVNSSSTSTNATS